MLIVWRMIFPKSFPSYLSDDSNERLMLAMKDPSESGLSW